MPSYLSPGVYVEEVSSGSKPIEGVGTAVGAFVGFAEKGPVNEPVLVTNWTQFAQRFGEFIEGSYLAHAVYGYFLNGGGSAYIVRVEAPEDVTDVPARAARAQLPAAGDDAAPLLTVTALQPGEAGNRLSVEVTQAGDAADDSFKLVVKRDGQSVESFDNLTLRRGPLNALSVVRRSSQLIALDRPADAVPPSVSAQLAKHVEVSLTDGAGPEVRTTPLNPADFIGSADERTGIASLEAVDDVTMLAVPDLMAAYRRGLLDEDGVKAVQLAVIAHCELMADRVAILDTLPDLTAQQVKTWRTEFTGYDSKYAALYWPWLKVLDPRSGKPEPLPPSGHIAGIWARSDDSRGVHKAPANEAVRGAIALELALTRGEHDQLNPIGINCIRAFPGQGIRVWGARTLSSDPEWRYLNVRRLFNYVEKSILAGTSWVVFEPNEPKLWDSVKRTITMFLRGVWRDGALYGRTPDDAFYVKCDEENNPAESRDQGILTVEVGIAAVKPAEFVVFRISQFADGAALDE
ncbi:tail protein [Streptomyces spinoverrucosus]|uniref:Tail protein n=1 Tax=Streptomyces spinoverrucosus TaxID=284043 RepID=A0A4Y3VRC2_9ACTN|nr:phage tail sheath subtilisin-like domain-containing protein [Streptomyces spinoverrucosus]GEC09572.1 tail protein [Streptomyces spinoverrucosus]GHB96022.1 tail protein [Streptomyces spinoverrucosus]